MEEGGEYCCPYIPPARLETPRFAGVHHDRDQTNSGGPGRRAGRTVRAMEIRIENTINKELGIDLRVHRDDVGMFARTGARQSYFDDPQYERFDPDFRGRPINDERRGGDPNTQVTRQGTLSTYAYAEGVIAVSGYRRFRRRTRPIFVSRLRRSLSPQLHLRSPACKPGAGTPSVEAKP